MGIGETRFLSLKSSFRLRRYVACHATSFDQEKPGFWPLQSVKSRFLLAAIVLLALVLRLYGIQYGLPYIYTSDAETRFVNPAVRMVTAGDLNPHWFGHPGSTVMYVLSVLYGLYFTAGRAVGAIPDLNHFKVLFETDPTAFFLIGRATVALLGALTVVLVYQAARSIYDERTGILAALFLAVSPLHHRFSQMARTDIPATFLVMLAFFFALQLSRRPGLRFYALAGLFVGLATATKYTAGLAIIPLLLAHFVAKTRATILDHKLTVALGFVLIGFLLGAPFVLLDWRTALRDIAIENRPSHLGADRLPGLRNHLWYLTGPLNWGLTMPIEALAGLGVGLALVRRRRSELLLLSFPLCYFVAIGSARLRWDRWIIPVLPFMTIFAAHGVVTLVGTVHFRRNLLLSLAAVLLAIMPTAQILRYDYRQSQDDTRTLARRWVESNISLGARIAQDWYSGVLSRERYDVLEIPTLSANPPRFYEEQGFKYLIVSSYMYGRYLAEPQKYPDNVAFYTWLFENRRLVHEIAPDDWNRPGPTIKIFEIETP